MSGEPVITFVGNLVADPELHLTATGSTIAKFHVASTPRYLDRQTDEWKDGDTIFLACCVFRQAAENVAESLRRGMRVIVLGRLTQRTYQKGIACEVEVDEVAPSLRYVTAGVTKNVRASVPGSGTGPAASAEAPSAPPVSRSDRGPAAPEDQKAPF